MAMAKVPVITSAIHGSTEGDDPFARIMRRAKACEGHDNVVSTSVILVHCVLDQPQMGSGAVVITNDDKDRAAALARELAAHYWKQRFELEPQVHTPTEAIARGLEKGDGPVLLVEAADCCGGGAAGDSVATLKALIPGSYSKNPFNEIFQERFAPFSHVVNEFKEAHIQREFFLRDSSMRSQPGT